MKDTEEQQIITYHDYEQHRLYNVLGVRCGDLLEVRYSALTFTPRLMRLAVSMFVDAYGLVPGEIAYHPHDLETMPQKSSDVFWIRNAEDATRILNRPVEAESDHVIGIGFTFLNSAEGMPTSVPYEADETLPRRCVAARYHVPVCEVCQIKERIKAYQREETPEADRQQHIAEALIRLTDLAKQGQTSICEIEIVVTPHAAEPHAAEEA